MPAHAQIDAASRELGIAVARRLREDPSRLGVGIGNLARWLSGEISASRRAAYREWEALLAEGDLEKVSAILEGDSEESQRLRQNSPFAGVLGPREVWRIKETARHAPTGS